MTRLDANAGSYWPHRVSKSPCRAMGKEKGDKIDK